MGQLDQTTYAPNEDEEYFALQRTKNGTLDVYRIDNFHDGYNVIKQDVRSDLFPDLSNLMLARKKESVLMVRFSAFGFSKDKEIVIASPWNSTQTKDKR